MSPLDPITLGVVWGALQSIAVEVGTTVHKTAYSEQAREGQDFSVAVFDPQGRMVAQGPYSPGHMGAMSAAVRNALAAHPVATLHPGDAILLNDPLLGSLRAQRSALRVGELRLVELAQRYGRDTVLAAMDEIIARSEASVRAAIAKIPDGVYTFEDFLDDYGPGTEPLRVHVTVTVAGDGVTVDYTGSSPQT